MAKDFTKWPNGQSPVVSGQIKSKVAKNEQIWPQKANYGNPVLSPEAADLTSG